MPLESDGQSALPTIEKPAALKRSTRAVVARERAPTSRRAATPTQCEAPVISWPASFSSIGMPLAGRSKSGLTTAWISGSASSIAATGTSRSSAAEIRLAWSSRACSTAIIQRTSSSPIVACVPDRSDCLVVGHRYDRIGRLYRRHRRTDERIMAQIEEALGDAVSVINIGAGAGAYEPARRHVVAVEPSEVMIDQRPTDGAAVVRAMAEALPARSGAFDAALATFTVHHWADPAAGLAEMRRVASRQVILTFDQDDGWLEQFWLTRDYLPQAHFRGTLFSGLDQVLREIRPARVEVVPVPADCTDGFFCAYWRRPEAYLDPEVRASISALALLEDHVLDEGLRRLEEDLHSGLWTRRNEALLALDTYDYGYRLVVSSR